MTRIPAFLSLLAVLSLTSCDANEPVGGGPHEQEVISRVALELQPDDGGDAILVEAVFDEAGVLQSVDSLLLTAGETYEVEVLLENTLVDPPEQIHREIRDRESESHRVFHTGEGGLAQRLTFFDLDLDSNGDPLGLALRLAALEGAPAEGALRVRLRHYEEDADLPRDKREDTADAGEVPGVIANDVDVAFPARIR